MDSWKKSEALTQRSFWSPGNSSGFTHWREMWWGMVSIHTVPHSTTQHPHRWGMVSIHTVPQKNSGLCWGGSRNARYESNPPTVYNWPSQLKKWLRWPVQLIKRLEFSNLGRRESSFVEIVVLAEKEKRWVNEGLQPVGGWTLVLRWPAPTWEVSYACLELRWTWSCNKRRGRQRKVTA